MKRVFDLIFSVMGIVFLCPFFILFALLIKIDSAGSVFFLQERVGRTGRLFKLYKFRTMSMKNNNVWQGVTANNDPRITKIGKFLRKYRIDELPQLFNVAKGEMSLVGPRPELARFIQYFSEDYQKVLKIKPGITDPATIKFRDESRNLTGEKVEQKYIDEILPQKIKLYLDYIGRQNTIYDLRIIFKTLYYAFINCS